MVDYRTTLQQEILKEVEGLEEEAQQELYAALNQHIKGRPLAEQDPEILQVTRDTLRQRLEATKMAQQEKSSLYSKIKERKGALAIGLASLVGIYGISRVPAVRDLYDHSAAYQKTRTEQREADQQTEYAEKKLKEVIDRNCTGEMSGEEFLDFYKIATGNEINNKAIVNTIRYASDSYLNIK